MVSYQFVEDVIMRLDIPRTPKTVAATAAVFVMIGGSRCGADLCGPSLFPDDSS